MTQTTAGRITEIIREHLKFYAGSGEWAAAVEAGQEIAAEIDALTRERDEARIERDSCRSASAAHTAILIAERDEAREMIARLKPSWMGDNPRPETLVETCQRLAGEVNALKRERDEARAEVARLTPLSEIHDAWRELYEGKESPSEESVVRFIEFAHAAAGRAYEAAKGTP